MWRGYRQRKIYKAIMEEKRRQAEAELARIKAEKDEAEYAPRQRGMARG